MVEFRILGSTELRRDGDEVDAILAGTKRLGLLAHLVLARPRGLQRRDKMLSLFWPEQGQKAARNALSNLLYHIRHALGEGFIVRRGSEEIGVLAAALWVDAIAFEEAMDRGDPRGALDLYRGDLLEGFHVPDAAPAFHHWLERERDRLRARAAEGAWALAEAAERAERGSEARAWARRAAGFSPFSEEGNLRLIRLLDRSGDRAGALRAYEAFAARFRAEWEMGPSEELEALVRAIRVRAPGEHRVSSTPILRLPAGPSGQSIAVLPFETLGTSHLTSFAEGIHGDLLTRLSDVSALQVISRTSVRRYRDTKKTIAEIGAELSASWVLEGEVQASSDHVQVNVRLVNAQKDCQAWARDYRRALSARNIFQIQSEITKEIARSLEAELTPEEKKQIEHEPTRDLSAYRLHAQGRRHLDERTEAGMRRALAYFQRAVEQDGRYVLAWVGIADALSLLNNYGYENAGDVLPRAEYAVRRALKLDSRSAEAHASLGLLHSVRFEGPQAIQALKRAVELRPGYAEAHNWLSWEGNLLGHREEALRSARRAVVLNPLSPEAVSNLSLSYLANGDLEKALAEARREHELGSPWGTGRFYEGLALYELRRFTESQEILRGLSAPWAGQGPRATLALACVATGDRAEARALLSQIEEEGDRFAVGLVRAALGQKEAAFTSFQNAKHLRDWPALAVRHFYRDVWRPLQGDPRFEELLREVDRSWGVDVKVQDKSPMLDPLAIAVLPFEDLGGEDEATPFAAGLHNDLLTKLSSVRTLTVIARTSVLRYRDGRAPISEVAKALGVGTIVEGGVRQAGNRVRLNVQLIDARDEALQWAETYERELTARNLFDIQSELAERIAGSLRAILTPQEQRRVDRRPTDDLDAYRLYVQGRRHLDERTGEGMCRALGYLQQAVDRDPSYALAWAGLSEARSLLSFYAVPVSEHSTDAMAAAQEAVALDPDAGEAYAALGITQAVRREGPAALRSLERAVELQPGYAEAHAWLGWVHLCLGSPAEALAAAEQAVKLDPLAPAYRVYLGEILLANGSIEPALREARRAREIQPEYGLTHFMEGLILHHDRRFGEAEAALERALPVASPGGAPTYNDVRTALALTRVAMGDRAEAMALVTPPDEDQSPVLVGLVRAALGDIDAAYDALAGVSSWSWFDTELVRYFFPDVLGTLREDRRYDRLLRQVDRSWGVTSPATSSPVGGP